MTIDRPNQARVVETTNANTERTHAIKETSSQGKKKIFLKGPLSEIFYRALNILYEKNSLYEGNYSMENAIARDIHLGVSNEGLFDFVKFIFQRKKKKPKEAEKPTKEEISLQWWIDANIDASGNLRQGLEIQGGEITISGWPASAMRRNGKLITDIEKELRADLKELLALYAKHKPVLLGVAKDVARFDKDLLGLPNNATLEKVEQTLLKHKGAIRPLMVRSFKEPSHTFLGEPAQGFTKRSSYKGKSWDEFVMEPSFKDAPAVKGVSITREEILSLIRLQAEIEKHYTQIYFEPGEEGWEQVGSIVDVTDFPIRAYYDELNENEQTHNVINYFYGENTQKSFTWLATNILQRLHLMSMLIWTVVRRSVVEVSAESLSDEASAVNEKVYIYTAIAANVSAEHVADFIALHSAAKAENKTVRLLLLVDKATKLEELCAQHAQLDILVRFAQMQSVTIESSLSKLVDSFA